MSFLLSVNAAIYSVLTHPEGKDTYSRMLYIDNHKHQLPSNLRAESATPHLIIKLANNTTVIGLITEGCRQIIGQRMQGLSGLVSRKQSLVEYRQNQPRRLLNQGRGSCSTFPSAMKRLKWKSDDSLELPSARI